MEALTLSDDVSTSILKPMEDRNEDLSRSELEEIELQRLPKAALEVAHFEDEVFHSPGLTWELSCTYLVVPISENIGTYVLLALNWDDNLGRWIWEVHGGVSGATSTVEAGKFLLRKMAEKKSSKDGSAFDVFLQKFL